MKNGLTTIVDTVAKVIGGIEKLATTRVMVGVPSNRTDRKDDEPINNAEIAYIQDNGAPEVNIPARPFMEPGVKAAQSSIEDGLKKTGQAALDGNVQAVDRGFNAVGLIGQASIRAKINEGIPPPLAESTLKARARRGRKGAQKELANRAAGADAGTELAKPLVDSAQMRNAINYVVRKA
jgi:hypothetical protein